MTGDEAVDGASSAAACSHWVVLRGEVLVHWNEVLGLILAVPEIHDRHAGQSPKTFLAPATNDSIIILV